jgi:2-phospho-L-lactate guanylyltransferase
VIAALIPCRTFRTGKSRLAALGGGRAALARALFGRVLDVVAPEVDAVLVATDGDDVAAAARERGAAVLYDDTDTLAGIADRGLQTLHAGGATAALVVMADLPAVTGADIARLRGALAGVDLALAPDRDRMGTNALAIVLPAPIPTCFGNPDSYHRHLTAARGLRVSTLERDGLALDLDVPADLDDLARVIQGSAMAWSSISGLRCGSIAEQELLTWISTTSQSSSGVTNAAPSAVGSGQPSTNEASASQPGYVRSSFFAPETSRRLPR